MRVRELIEKLQAVVDHDLIVVMASDKWDGDDVPPPGNECDGFEFAFIDPRTLARSDTPTDEQAVILYPAM